MPKPLSLTLTSINTAFWIIRSYATIPGKRGIAIIPRYDQGVSSAKIEFSTGALTAG
jgi:hypothetical protein